jgi:quercetin dioxygenase-like cupin family protein
MKSNHNEFLKPDSLSTLNNHFHAARVAVARGSITQNHSNETEVMIIVLEGAWRFHFPKRVVTLKKDEVLRIPAHEPYSAEALADTIALKVAAGTPQDHQPLALPHDDPDQYLWGV